MSKATTKPTLEEVFQRIAKDVAETTEEVIYQNEPFKLIVTTMPANDECAESVLVELEFDGGDTVCLACEGSKMEAVRATLDLLEALKAVVTVFASKASD